MNDLKLSETTHPSSVQSTVYSDGMVVNSEDLNTAQQYPLALMQIFMRAYFGCGVVCGFDVTLVGDPLSHNYCLRVEPGVAMDCLGYPMQLCEPSVINLTPESCDPCNPLDYQNLPTDVLIAIRRSTVEQSPRNDGNHCDTQGKAQCNYSRAREVLVIKVFSAEAPPHCLCRSTLVTGAEDDGTSGADTDSSDTSGTDAAASGVGRSNEEIALNTSHKISTGISTGLRQSNTAQDPCECLKECGECHCCDCCDESWVLLASVKVTQDGLTDLNTAVRKYIKPIQCLCGPSQSLNRTVDMSLLSNSQIIDMLSTSGTFAAQTAVDFSKIPASDISLIARGDGSGLINKIPEAELIAGFEIEKIRIDERIALDTMRKENIVLKEALVKERLFNEDLLKDDTVKEKITAIMKEKNITIAEKELTDVTPELKTGTPTDETKTPVATPVTAEKKTPVASKVAEKTKTPVKKKTTTRASKPSTDT
ncbi:MAG: hypothetical protein V3T17_02375 [Pseudomonadales bacterium]